MHGQIPECDWKEWRKLSSVALERFCARVLDEAATFTRGTDTAHSRYLRLFCYIRQCDEDIAAVFDGPRRSRAYLQIAAALARGIVHREELDAFSEETQEVVKILCGEMT